MLFQRFSLCLRYGLADVEPFYRFDTHRIDPLAVRGGIGYVLSARIRLEFIYHAAFRRPAGSSGLEHTDNIFRLNIKIGLGKGILQRMFEGATRMTDPETVTNSFKPNESFTAMHPANCLGHAAVLPHHARHFQSHRLPPFSIDRAAALRIIGV